MDMLAPTASTGDFAFSSSVRADVWREAVVIMFLDNFIYSPRYNRERNQAARYPAISFTYFRDGKPLYRCINEYTESEFSASRESPECHIGDSFFKFEKAAYGSGYSVSINAKLSGGKRLEAQLEWLSI